MITPEQKKIYNHAYGIQNRDAILANKKVYAKNNKEKIRAYRKQYYDENKEEWLRSQREYYSRPENRARKIFGKAKERAKKADLDFDITIDDIIIPEVCPYLGITLTHELGKGQQLTNSSIDRIDNTKGYVKGNVRIISRLANSMKTNSTRDQREAFARAILSDPSF